LVWVTHPTLVFANQGRVDMNLSHVEIYEGSTVDTDGDGEPDFSDLDDDNDDLSDETEDSLGTDPLSNDTDGDVMPDGWEHFNALDPKDPSDADEDFDGDGFTSLEEYQSGTNPRDPHSHPQVEDQQESDYLSYLILLAAVVLMTIALIVVALILKRRRKES
ncbi:MAG: hypothetical protein ACE5IJ_10705, partial [Thermoplasmata archaeon]